MPRSVSSPLRLEVLEAASQFSCARPLLSQSGPPLDISSICDMLSAGLGFVPKRRKFGAFVVCGPTSHYLSPIFSMACRLLTRCNTRITLLIPAESERCRRWKKQRKVCLQKQSKSESERGRPISPAPGFSKVRACIQGEMRYSGRSWGLGSRLTLPRQSSNLVALT